MGSRSWSTRCRCLPETRCGWVSSARRTAWPAKSAKAKVVLREIEARAKRRTSLRIISRTLTWDSASGSSAGFSGARGERARRSDVRNQELVSVRAVARASAISGAPADDEAGVAHSSASVETVFKLHISFTHAETDCVTDHHCSGGEQTEADRGVCGPRELGRFEGERGARWCRRTDGASRDSVPTSKKPVPQDLRTMRCTSALRAVRDGAAWVQKFGGGDGRVDRAGESRFRGMGWWYSAARWPDADHCQHVGVFVLPVAAVALSAGRACEAMRGPNQTAGWPYRSRCRVAACRVPESRAYAPCLPAREPPITNSLPVSELTVRWVRLPMPWLAVGALARSS